MSKDKKWTEEEIGRLMNPASEFNDKSDEWKEGYNEGIERVLENARSKDLEKDLEIKFSLDQIESQIKILQQSRPEIDDVYRWCGAALDLVNRAKRV